MSWTRTTRASGLEELVCRHGIGHPSQRLTCGWKDSHAIHGCDGCCAGEAFIAAEHAFLGAVGPVDVWADGDDLGVVRTEAEARVLAGRPVQWVDADEEHQIPAHWEAA